MFQTIIIQPIYNLLLAIYGIIPGHDLGVSLILFTLIIRIAMWPLLKKQLHQTKVMRDLQPELAKVKKAAGGDRQKEGLLMMELYKEKGISPFGSLGLTIIQLPLFIGVFQAARDLSQHLDKINSLSYSFVAKIPHVAEVIQNHQNFNFKSFGFIDLSNKAFQNGGVYMPVFVLAIAATVFQYIQSKQLIPQPKEKKTLRDILRASAKDGEQPAQEDMSAAMGGSMLILMPLLTMLFALSAYGAMVMYLLASSVIGIWQQSLIFKKDTDEMEAEVVSVKTTKAAPAKEAAPATTKPAEKITKGKVVTKTRIISPSESSQTPKSSKKKRRR